MIFSCVFECIWLLQVDFCIPLILIKCYVFSNLLSFFWIVGVLYMYVCFYSIQLIWVWKGGISMLSLRWCETMWIRWVSAGSSTYHRNIVDPATLLYATRPLFKVFTFKFIEKKVLERHSCWQTTLVCGQRNDAQNLLF